MVRPKERMEAFSKAAAKPTGSSPGAFINAILQERPDLEGQMVYFPKQGMEGHTAIIGDEVFKGPRTREQVASFEREIEVLTELKNSDLPVPKITYQGTEAAFYGMTRLTGVTLDEAANNLTADACQRLAQDILDFIIGFARIVPRREHLYAMHWDLWQGNILIDPATQKLSGIIDFGQVKYVEKDDLCTGFWIPKTYVTGEPRPPKESLEKIKQIIQEEFQIRKNEIPDPVSVQNTRPHASPKNPPRQI